MKNREFANQNWFIKLCKKLNIKPTKRQASKYRMEKGTAFKNKD